MQNTLSHEANDDDFADPQTKREAPSGRWIIAVDRGARKLEDAIARLESGADVVDVLDELRTAHALVNGVSR